MFVNKKIKIKLMLAVVLLFVLVFAPAFINFNIIRQSNNLIYQNIDNVPTAQAVLVLGAKVKSNGEMSDVLLDRAVTALELYQAKKVEKILVSGDHGTKGYDEVNTLKKYFLDNGVLPADIFLDHAGFDTYDSLYRAKYIFQARSLIIVTQNFHLPRTVYIGKKLGLDVAGLSADKHIYLGAYRWELREILARVKAFGSVVFHTKPKYLGAVIPLEGDSMKSWD
jgi:SanA protein